MHKVHWHAPTGNKGNGLWACAPPPWSLLPTHPPTHSMAADLAEFRHPLLVHSLRECECTRIVHQYVQCAPRLHPLSRKGPAWQPRGLLAGELFNGRACLASRLHHHITCSCSCEFPVCVQLLPQSRLHWFAFIACFSAESGIVVEGSLHPGKQGWVGLPT